MTRAGITISVLASIVAATIVGGSIIKADATDGAQPNTSCATTTACLEGDNTSTGPGIKGTSTKGNGVVGSTKSKGTTSGTSHAGVLGQDLQAGGGTGNSGVEGTSTNGTGVLGISTNSQALEGVSTSGIGLLASGSIGAATSGTVGIVGSGTTEGVQGNNSATGDAFFANGFGGDLFRGNNSHAQDVFVVDDNGGMFLGGGLDVIGGINTNAPIEAGDTVSTAFGVLGRGASEGVEGINSTTGDSLFADGFGGNLIRGNNSQGSDVFVVDDSGNVFANNFFLKVAPGVMQPTTDGRTVRTYGTQATMPTIDDVGEAQLVSGVAHVALDPGFASAIDRRSGYIVSITPEGMTQGVLCVTERTMSGFTVRENMNGRSSVTFSYRLTAKPYGSTAPRLPAMAVPAHFDRPMPKKAPRAMTRVPAPKHHAKPVLPARFNAFHG